MLEQFETGIFYFPEDVRVFKFLSILSSTNPLFSMRKKPILHVGSLIFDKFSQQADVFDFLNVLPRYPATSDSIQQMRNYQFPKSISSTSIECSSSCRDSISRNQSSRVHPFRGIITLWKLAFNPFATRPHCSIIIPSKQRFVNLSLLRHLLITVCDRQDRFSRTWPAKLCTHHACIYEDNTHPLYRYVCLRYSV